MVRQRWQETGRADFEWIENGLKQALMKDASALLEQLLNDLPLESDVSRHGEQSYGKRSRTIQTALGPLKLERRYYYDSQMRRGRIPWDQTLGLIDGYSPGLARLMCWAGAQSGSYEAASEALRRYAGLNVDARQIQRMVNQLGPKLADVLDRPWQPQQNPAAPTTYVSVDATGVPTVAEELQGRRGKQPDGSAKTREVKLGCVFTQHHVDEKGRPWRDLDSTTYVASFETAGDFGHRIYRESVRRKVPQSQRVIFLGDGAPWIWEIAKTHFPQAIQILDFYHASQHLKLLAEALHPEETPTIQSTLEHWQQCLKEGRLDQIVAEASIKMPRQGPRKKEAHRQLAYLENNRPRMQYGTFKKRGWFIGSGVVEAGCKTLIGQRLKQSGMFWSLPGAQNILTLRCATSSRRFDQAWDSLQRRNDLSLALAA